MNADDMTMTAGNSTSSSSMMIMEMTTTFSKWSEYRLQLLFVTWNIQTQWQFALTWFAVAAAVVSFHFIECIASTMKSSMNTLLDKTKRDGSKGSETDEGEDTNGGDVRVNSKALAQRPLGWQSIKLFYAFVMAVKYALSLFLMLVAMTFNPSLFLALFVGYVAGEYMCLDFRINLKKHSYDSLLEHVNAVEAMIRYALCIPTTGIVNLQAFQYVPVPEAVPVDATTVEGRAMPYIRYALWTLPRVISLTYLVLLLVWILDVEGGLGYNEATVFGWHALLMSFLVAVHMNEALLIYRAPLLPQLVYSPVAMKICHSLCHVLGITCIILGLIAIRDYKIWSPKPTAFPFYTAYSSHSWMGILTVALFGIQVIYGGIIFGMKWIDLDRKERHKSVHHFLGECLYAFALATCATGFQSMQSSDLASSATSSGDDTMSMSASGDDTSSMSMGGDDDSSGYEYYSFYAHLSSVGPLLLMMLGMSTFAVLKFLPRIAPAEVAKRSPVDEGL